jgi:branched-chain amino acid aminotransferase
MMNVGFVINDTFVTPALEETILKGVTRDSVLTILNDMGIKTKERRISIDEILDEYEKGKSQRSVWNGNGCSDLVH